MAKNNDGDYIAVPSGDTRLLEIARRIATIQRLSTQHLQDQGARIGHLLSVMNVATGSLSALHGGMANRHMVNDGESWKRPKSEKPQYDGGADAALDTLLTATAVRLTEIVENKDEWSTGRMSKLGDTLMEWASWEKMRTHQEANFMAAQRRPCVLHTVELFCGPRDLWYAVIVPFAIEEKEFPVIGVGDSPLLAMEDFDRAFETGELNPAAVLWLEEERNKLKKPTTRRAKKGTK